MLSHNDQWIMDKLNEGMLLVANIEFCPLCYPGILEDILRGRIQGVRGTIRTDQVNCEVHSWANKLWLQKKLSKEGDCIDNYPHMGMDLIGHVT